MNSPADPRQLASARVLVLIAAVLWSSSGFFAKAPFFAGWPGPTLAFWRAIFALVILLPLVRRPVWNWRIVPMSLAFAAMNYTYLSALEFGSAANAIWLQCLAPTWTLLVGVWLLKERASRGDWRMAAFSLAGIGLILFCELRRASTEEHALAAVIFGVSSGMLYAAVVLFLRVLRGADAGWLIAVNHAVTVARADGRILLDNRLERIQRQRRAQAGVGGCADGRTPGVVGGAAVVEVDGLRARSLHFKHSVAAVRSRRLTHHRNAHQEARARRNGREVPAVESIRVVQ